MAEPGMVQGCKWEPLGSELTAAAAIGDTVLQVEWTGQFDEGGMIDLAGERIAIEAVDDDASSITLVSPITVAADESDPIYVVTGGQIATDYVASVTIGEGHPADVIIPFDQRDLWPEGQYEDPVPVVLSDDLEKIDSVPNRRPVRDAAFVYNPHMRAYLFNPLPVPDGTWTNVAGWFIEESEDVTYDAGTGEFQIHTDGIYDIKVGVTFGPDGPPSVGSRAVRMRYEKWVGDEITRMNKYPASGTTGFEFNDDDLFYEGERIAVEVWQNSGSTGNLLGYTPTPTLNTKISIRRAVA